MSNGVTIGRKTFDVYSFTGDVVDDKKWASTHVSGGGGGGYTHDGTGHASSVSISSTTTTHDQFFLRSKSGKEQSFEFSDAHLATRVGHALTVFWAIKRGKKSGHYIAVYNHTTDELTLINDGIDGLRAGGKVVVGILELIRLFAPPITVLAFFPLVFVFLVAKKGAGIRYFIEWGWTFWMPAVALFGSEFYGKRVAEKYRYAFSSKVRSVLPSLNSFQPSDVPTQLAGISNLPVCPKCSAQTNENSKFCENCGTAISPA